MSIRCDDFSEKVKRALAERVGNVCSNPDCGAHTSGPQTDSTKALNLGVAAHMTAASPKGPRYNLLLTPQQRRHTDNGIWLCQNCAKLVDNDSEHFTEALLLQWKKNAEEAALANIGKTAPIGFVDPEELWKLLMKHLPQQTIYSSLQGGYAALNELHPDYTFSVHMRDGQTVFVLQPKRADVAPMEFSLPLTFPETVEGQRKREELDTFIKTGTPVELDESILRWSDIPDIIKKILPVANHYKLKLATSKSQQPMIMSLRIKSADGSSYTLPYTLEFLTIRAGTEEVAISNVSQKVPCHVEMRIKKDGHANVEWSFNLEGRNVYWLLQSLLFKQICENGGWFILGDLETGEEHRATLTGFFSDVPSSSRLIELCKRTLWIQEMTDSTIMIPKREFYTAKDEAEIEWVEEILRTGYQLRPPENIAFTIHARTPGNMALLRSLLDRPGQSFENRLPEWKEKVLETDVPLGPVHLICPSVKIYPDDEEACQRFLIDNDAPLPFVLRLVAIEGVSFEVRYVQWPKIGLGT